MELRHLRYFVAVAEELHFGRAAHRLFMAQPPLSQQIRQLEQEVGALLLERTNRRVQLTAAGAAFLEDALAILQRVDAAVLRARRVAIGEAGWLGVGFVGSATYDALPTILREFRVRYPDIELVLLELLGTEHASALRDHRIHVSFARVPDPEEDLVQETIARDPLMVALPLHHRLADRISIPFPELAHEPFIVFPPQSSYTGYILRLCEQAGFVPHIVQQTGEMQTAISLVSAGIGITLAPAAVLNVRRDGVVYLPLTDPAPLVELTMTYRQNDPSPVLRHFLEIGRNNT